MIKHYGMRRIKGQGDSYRPMSMVAQVADVKSTLVSVHRLLEAGNRVHFEPGNCYVEHITTRVKTKIIDKGWAFEVGFWVPRTEKAEPENENRTRKCNPENQSFPWQDKPWAACLQDQSWDCNQMKKRGEVQLNNRRRLMILQRMERVRTKQHNRKSGLYQPSPAEKRSRNT